MKIHVLFLILIVALFSCSRDDVNKPNRNEQVAFICGYTGEGEASSISNLNKSDLIGYWSNCPGHLSEGLDPKYIDICEFRIDGSFYIYDAPSFYKKSIMPKKEGTFTLDGQELTISLEEESVRIIGLRGYEIVYRNMKGQEISMSKYRCAEFYCGKNETGGDPLLTEDNCRKGREL